MDHHGSTPVLQGLDHHVILVLLAQLSVLLFAARLMGELMRRFRIPAVVGELTAGVILGPSILGVLAPVLQRALFPPIQAQSDLLAVVSWIGVLCLMLLTGLETDIALIKRRGHSALLVSAGGILVPFLFGLVLGWLMPQRFLAAGSPRLVFSLFMAVAMSISAVPVIAKVLIEMNLMRRDIGQIMVAAGMTDDTLGWILLSVVGSLAARGAVDIWTVSRSVLSAIAFIAIGLTLGRAVIARILALVDDWIGGVTAQFSALLVMGFGAAAVTQQLGIEAVLGAFVVGVVTGQAPRFRNDVAHVLETFTAGFVAPIFFVAAGLKVDLIRLADTSVLPFAFIVLAVACIGKFLGAYFGAWLGRLGHWERLALGAGMNARGAMEIVVATVGLGLHVLTLEMYSVVVMIAIVTSLMAPPMLRWSLSHVTLSGEEAERLERERVFRGSFIHAIRRVLIVASNEVTTALAARVTSLLAKNRRIEISLLAPQFQQSKHREAIPSPAATSPRAQHTDEDGEEDVGDPSNSSEVRVARSLAELTEVHSSLSRLTGIARSETQSVKIRKRSGVGLSEIALSEAALGFDLLVLGAKPRRGGAFRRALFGQWVDPVVVNANCATLIVEQARGKATLERLADGGAIERILVPTIGTEYARRALEIACGIAISSHAKVLLLHVVPQIDLDQALLLDREPTTHELGRDMIEIQAEFGRKLGANIETRVSPARGPDREIVRVASDFSADLMVVGSQLRPTGERAYLGRRAEHVLHHSPCPVLVLAS